MSVLANSLTFTMLMACSAFVEQVLLLHRGGTVICAGLLGHTSERPIEYFDFIIRVLATTEAYPCAHPIPVPSWPCNGLLRISSFASLL
uniref:Secreted protein n=1 Tax=Physcomitrium patens TaxID=3218 RepID=A0A2K1KH44_PHYPA|nr:hypothetical protein PHYPA_009460 [Physcomitrium patens]